jgi:hypothetical protein
MPRQHSRLVLCWFIFRIASELANILMEIDFPLSVDFFSLITLQANVAIIYLFIYGLFKTSVTQTLYRQMIW